MMKRRFAAFAALVSLSLAGTLALADDHAYTEGPVVNITKIRTEYGRFDDYMKYLDTTWKKSQEAAKKAGYILDYKVFVAEPRNENDPDIILVITYRNWAALDNGLAKADEITKLIEGTVAASNAAATERGKIRRVLGSETVQEALLK